MKISMHMKKEVKNVTILDFLLSQNDNTYYQIFYRFPLRCDCCREIFYEIDNEYSIYGSVAKLKKGSQIAYQYDGIYENDIELLDIARYDSKYTDYSKIFIFIESESEPEPDKKGEPLVESGFLCRDCQLDSSYPNI